MGLLISFLIVAVLVVIAGVEIMRSARDRESDIEEAESRARPSRDQEDLLS